MKKIYFPAALLEPTAGPRKQNGRTFIAWASGCCRSTGAAGRRPDRLATKGAKRPWLRLLRLCLMRPDAHLPIQEVAAISLHSPRFRDIFLAQARRRCGGGVEDHFILAASNGPS